MESCVAHAMGCGKLKELFVNLAFVRQEQIHQLCEFKVVLPLDCLVFQEPLGDGQRIGGLPVSERFFLRPLKIDQLLVVDVRAVAVQLLAISLEQGIARTRRVLISD